MGSLFPYMQWIVFAGITLIAWLCIVYGTKGIALFKVWFGNTAESRLDSMYLFVDGNRVFFYFLFGLLLLPLAVWALFRSLPVAILILVMVIAAPKIVIRVMRSRFIAQLEAALPDALAQMSGSMKVGSSLQGSIEAMVNETKGPLSKEFGQMLKECRVGLSLEEALNNLDQRVRSENLSLVIAATNISRDVGGNLGETFERMGDMLRQKLSLEARIDALTAQGKLQGVVVGLLPVVICAVMFFMEPETMAFMTGSLAGWIWMLLIAVMLLMGGFMIRKIVNIDV